MKKCLSYIPYLCSSVEVAAAAPPPPPTPPTPPTPPVTAEAAEAAPEVSSGSIVDEIPPPSTPKKDAQTQTISPATPDAVTLTKVATDKGAATDKAPAYDKCSLARNEIKEAIRNNAPIEEKLHVISVISNPCNFKKRYRLMREYIQRMEFEENVVLYIVEMVYGPTQPFAITSATNPRHLQLRTETPLWHKENMINLGVRALLPPDWKAFAWIDADLDFDSPHWALDTLKILNGCKDIVQLFSHAVDMAEDETTMNVYNGFGYQYSKGLPYTYKFPNYWHCGYAFAYTRAAYEKMGDGGIFDLGILGASDHIMTFCFMNKGLQSINERYSADFRREISEYEARVKNLRLGYLPVVIRHFFHGSKANRRYVERNEILLKYDYSPTKHITRDENGVYVPTADFPQGFKDEIMDYFKQRNEDE